MTNYIIYNSELHHHGVKGMKWGVRRARKSGGGKRGRGKKKPMTAEEKLDKVLKEQKRAKVRRTVGTVAAIGGLTVAAVGGTRLVAKGAEAVHDFLISLPI